MIGKLLGNKKEKFALELPAQGNEPVAVEPAIAPAIVETATAESATETVAPVAVAATPAPSYDNTEAIILAAVQAASREAATAAATQTVGFAENYLVNAGNNVSRRRPGGNMAAFKAMAQTIK